MNKQATINLITKVASAIQTGATADPIQGWNVDNPSFVKDYVAPGAEKVVKAIKSGINTRPVKGIVNDVKDAAGFVRNNPNIVKDTENRVRNIVNDNREMIQSAGTIFNDVKGLWNRYKKPTTPKVQQSQPKVKTAAEAPILKGAIDSTKRALGTAVDKVKHVGLNLAGGPKVDVRPGISQDPKMNKMWQDAYKRQRGSRIVNTLKGNFTDYSPKASISALAPGKANDSLNKYNTK